MGVAEATGRAGLSAGVWATFGIGIAFSGGAVGDVIAAVGNGAAGTGSFSAKGSVRLVRLIGPLDLCPMGAGDGGAGTGGVTALTSLSVGTLAVSG